MNEKIQTIIDLMQRDDSVSAPIESIKWAKNLYRTHAPAPKPSILRRLVAALQMDLAPGTAFGERSSSVGQERQMLFTVEDIGIDVRISGSGTTFKIRAQILNEGFSGATVDLDQDGKITTINVGENGSFLFETVSSGETTLVIRSANTEISIPSFTI
jgi:hypothetical protein